MAWRLPGCARRGLAWRASQRPAPPRGHRGHRSAARASCVARYLQRGAAPEAQSQRAHHAIIKIFIFGRERRPGQCFPGQWPSSKRPAAARESVCSCRACACSTNLAVATGRTGASRLSALDLRLRPRPPLEDRHGRILVSACAHGAPAPAVAAPVRRVGQGVLATACVADPRRA